MALPKLTGGSIGLSGISKETTLGITLFFTLLSIILVHNYLKTKFGRNALAIKTDELAAKTLGINTFTQKEIVFSISCGLAGLAGGLYAHYITYIEPNMFNWDRSIELVIIIFVGGFESLSGCVVTAIGLTLFVEFLRFTGEARFLIYYSIALLVIVLKPGGIFGKKEITLQPIVKFLNKLMKNK